MATTPTARTLLASLLLALVTSAAARPLSRAADGRSLHAAADGGGDAEAAIVGGRVVTQNRYPYAAVLFNAKGAFCSGALIHPQVILTAAHCVERNATVGAKVGARNWAQDDILGRTYYARRAARAITHPDYARLQVARAQFSDMAADVALLVLESPLPLGWPLLAVAGAAFKVPPKLHTLGYGLTDPDGAGGMSQELREVELDYVPRARCNTLLNRQFPVYNLTDANICAGVLAGGHDSCNGDSGGPLFVRGATAAADVAVGLTSFGEGCAQKGVPAGYTNLRKYAAWVAATLKAEGFVMPAPATPIKTKTG